MELVIVERVFAEPLQLEALQARMQTGEGCHMAHRVRFIRTLLSSDGLRAICEYEAPDAEAVRAVNRQLDAPYERIWTARVISSEHR
ncbi:MAG TPA: nickel-binding protein [Polyangiales bacterium]|nr:nickel-binding protein [Polyangiales bacterium]